MKSTIAFSIVLLMIFSFPAWAEESPLGEITGIRVFTDLSNDSETSGLTANDIQTDVELMLRQYGIKVLSQEEYKSHGVALNVFVRVVLEYTVSGKQRGFFSVVILEVYEYAFLVRTFGQLSSPKPYRVRTWEASRFATGPPEALKKLTLESIQIAVKTFANNYLAANPS